jgi:hypothetical protein
LCINYNYILHLCPQRRQLFCFSLLSREYLHHLLDSWWIALLWIVSLYCLRICIICVLFIMNSEGVKVSWEWEQKEHFVQWAQSSITMDHFFSVSGQQNLHPPPQQQQQQSFLVVPSWQMMNSSSMKCEYVKSQNVTVQYAVCNRNWRKMAYFENYLAVEHL